MLRVIQIHVDAPPKPAEGSPCNGCGLCCLAEPCPVGILVSRRRQGSCSALRWSAARSRYECGMLVDPLEAIGWRPRGTFAALLGRGLRRWTRRLIAAGQGCDASVAVSAPVRSAAPPEA